MNIFDVTRVESNLTFAYNKRYEHPRRSKDRKDGNNRLQEEPEPEKSPKVPQKPTQTRTQLRYDISKQNPQQKPDLNETALTEAYHSRYQSPKHNKITDSPTPKLIHYHQSKPKPKPVEIRPKPQQLSLYEENRKPMTLTRSFSTIYDSNESIYEVKSKKIVFNESIGAQFEDESEFQQSYTAFNSLAKNVRKRW